MLLPARDSGGPFNGSHKHKISPSRKRKAVLAVLKEGRSVTSVARELGVARKTIYSWIKRYKKAPPKIKPKALKPNYPRGKDHPNSYRQELKERLLKEVVKNPQASISDLAKKIGAGRHAVYNLLHDLDLTTLNARQVFKTLYSAPGRLAKDIKLSVARSAIEKDKSISDLAREHHVSRKTIYKWIDRLEKEGGIDEKYVAGYRHHKAFSKEQIKAILKGVVQTPELSIHKLTKGLGVSSHGLHNVLTRYGLTYKGARIAYARARKEDATQKLVPESFLDRVRLVWEQFIPSLAPAPPPDKKTGILQILKFFSVTAFTSFLIGFASIYWINLLGTASIGGAIGLILATIALINGSFFFLYSLKYYITLAIVLSYSQQEDNSNSKLVNSNSGKGKGFLGWLLGLGNGDLRSRETPTPRAIGLEPSLEHIILKRDPFISIHIPFYNEKYVVERAIKAATNFDYPGEYEVILCDDSTDETTEIIKRYMESFGRLRTSLGEGYSLTECEVRPGVVLKHLHRTSRSGFKGGALRLALRVVDPRTEFISVFDADFVPYPDTLELFLKYFQATTGSQDLRFTIQESGINHKSSIINPKSSRIAAVQGYQWHVLNKSENWITRGVRSEYAGSYVIERSGTEIYSGLKQISGAVYMVRRDVLEEVGWETSITEDFQLTLKLYEKGYKVVYTPYIQAPAECVSTLKRLIRQRMRWAEGHSNNIRRMFMRLMFGKWLKVNGKREFKKSPLSTSEKLEFLYLSPYYLQAFFFLIGTLSWLISETIFAVRLPFWTSLWGWSLVLTNMLSLPLMNAVGLFLEESEERDYQGLLSFVALTYILVPFQAYASLKGFLQKEEGPWFRTPKTGKITDIFTRGRFYRFISGILPGKALGTRQLGNSILSSAQSLVPNAYLSLATANNRFDNPKIHPRKIRWLSKATLAILLLITLSLNYLSFFTPKAYAQAADPAIQQQINIIDQKASHWSRRKTVTIDNSSNSNTLTNYQTKMIVAYDSDMQADFDDLRFTNTSGTPLDYWIESKTDSSTATVWIEVDSVAASTTTDIYMYYGNSLAETGSNIHGTFLFGDDFDDYEYASILDTGLQVYDSTKIGNDIYVIGSMNGASNEVKVYKSSDDGATWEPLASPWSSNKITDYIESDGSSKLYVTATDNTTKDVVFKKSTDFGESWGSEVTIYSSTDAIDPSILYVSSSLLLVAFSAADGSNDDLKIYKSENDGTSWSFVVDAVDNSSIQIEDVDLFKLANGDILLTYEKETTESGESGDFQKRSTNNGTSWGSETTIYDATNADDEGGAYLQFTNGELWYLFATDEDNIGSSYDKDVVKRLISTDNGATWGSKATLFDSFSNVELNALFDSQGRVRIFVSKHYWSGSLGNITPINVSLGGMQLADKGWSQDDGLMFFINDSGEKIARVDGNPRTSTRAFTSSSYSSTDYIVETRVKGIDTTPFLRVVTRYQDVDNHYLISMEALTNQIIVFKRVGSTYTSLNAVSQTVAANTWYDLRVVHTGTTIQTYVNGTLRNNFTDSTYSSGKVGLSAYFSANQWPVYFDDFRVRKYTSPEPSTSFSAESTNTSYNPIDDRLGIFQFDPAKYNGETVYLEALHSTDGSTWSRTRSSALTMPSAAKNFTVRLRVGDSSSQYPTVQLYNLTDGSETGTITFGSVSDTQIFVKSVRLILVQTDPTAITDTQSQVEVGDAVTTRSTFYRPLTDKKIYRYDSSKFSGTVTVYFEASLSNAVSGQTAYAALYEDGTECADQVSGSEVSVSSTSWSRARSSAITLTTGTDYMVCFRASANTARLADAKIILEQADVGGLTAIELIHDYINSGASGWYSSSWTRRKKITVNNSSNATPLIGYAVNFTVTYDSDMQADFDDLRFVTRSQNSLDYWIQNKTDSTSANVWIALDRVEGNTEDFIYMYYGNGSATSESSGANTFQFFDDFDTDPPYTSIGAGSGTKSVSGSTITFTETAAGSGLDHGYQLDSSFPITSGQQEVRASFQPSVLKELHGLVFCNISDANRFYKFAGTQSGYGLTPEQAYSGSGYQVVYAILNDFTCRGFFGIVHDDDASAAAQSKYEWVFVRKYSSPEPSTTIGTEETSTTATEFINLFEPGSFVGGTFTYLFESSFLTSSGTGYSRLYNNSDSTQIDERSTTSTSYTRVRSTSLTMPSSSKTLDTRLENSTSSSSWLIIQVSDLQIPENLLISLPLLLFLPALIKRFVLKKPAFVYQTTLQNGMSAADSKNKFIIINYKRKVIKDG